MGLVSKSATDEDIEIQTVAYLSSASTATAGAVYVDAETGPYLKAEKPVTVTEKKHEPFRVMPIVNGFRLGRNKRCFCGSGLKFKECHLPRMK